MGPAMKGNGIPHDGGFIGRPYGEGRWRGVSKRYHRHVRGNRDASALTYQVARVFPSVEFGNRTQLQVIRFDLCRVIVSFMTLYLERSVIPDTGRRRLPSRSQGFELACCSPKRQRVWRPGPLARKRHRVINHHGSVVRSFCEHRRICGRIR